MTDPILLRDVLLASEGLAAAVLLPVLAWLAASCFPKRAALRHLIWLAAFIGLLALPPMALLLPARLVIERPAPPTSVASVSGPTITSSVSAVLPQMTVSKLTLTDITTPVLRQFGAPELAIIAFALWLFGLAVVLLYHAMALLSLRRLHRRYTALAPPSPEFQGRWQLFIATQPGAHGPLTWGISRPVILLPHHALSWPHERLVAVLTHEISHVRRHDMLAQVIAQLACALYWPNPLVWLGARRLRREAEIAADDAVLSAGVKPSTYAETLMALAAEFREASPGLAMAAPSTLEARITSLLTFTQSRLGVTAIDVLKTACLGGSAIVLIALARPDLAVAQQAATVTPIAAAPVAATVVTKPVSVTQASLIPAAPRPFRPSHRTPPRAPNNAQSPIQTSACALREPPAPLPMGLGTIVALQDPVLALADIPSREARQGGPIDPNYISDTRAVVRQDNGRIQTFDVHEGMIVQVGDRVRLQNSFRDPTSTCSYIPILIDADLGPALMPAGAPQ